MCLLRKITYGEFSEFVREKKITYNLHIVFFTGNIILCQILTDDAFKTLTTGVPIMSNIIYNGVIGRGFWGLFPEVTN